MNMTAETFGTNPTETIWGEPLIRDTMDTANNIVVVAEVAKTIETKPYDVNCLDCLHAVVGITTPTGRVKICSRHLAGVFHAALLRKRGIRAHAD